MPHWETRPPADPRGNGLEIVRVQPGRPLVAVILSDNMLGTRTHFWARRTMPCEQPSAQQRAAGIHATCEACDKGMPWRWHGYLAIQTGQGEPTQLLEVTAQAAEKILGYRKIYGTLRGCRVKLMRANYAKNSRVLVETSPADLTKIALNAEPNLIDALGIMWNLPSSAASPAPAERGIPTVETLSDLADHSRRDLIARQIDQLAAEARHPTGNGSRKEP